MLSEVAMRMVSTFVAGVAILLFIDTASAQPTGKDGGAIRKAPGVFVSFQGSVVGTNLAAVLEKVHENPADLPTEQYSTVAGDTICGILERRGYPPPCDALLPLLDTLNEKPVTKVPLQLNTSLTLPALEITQTSAIRVFSKTDPEQREKGNELVAKWRHLEAQKVEPPRPSETFGVRYNTYEFVIPTSGDKEALAVFQRLIKLRSRNILITPLLAEENGDSDLKSGGFPTVEDIKTFCQNGSLKDRNYRYVDLMGGDRDALALIQGSPAPEAVPVYVIDTILHPSPNLAPSGLASATPLWNDWACPWGGFIKSQHHATHLAGIIGSRGKPYFFEGIAPNASIESYEWSKPDEADPTKTVKARPDRHIALGQHFDQTYGASNLPVYLAALQFEGYFAGSLSDGQLPRPEARYQGRPLETAIRQIRPLLIAAAGQPEKTTELPAPLSPTSPRSPQNLATFENVVVVTACKECGGSRPTFYERTNYSATGFRMIHVAGPGGDPIPGWITNTNIGAAEGTSQATAFVAGVAASMIGHFPRIYTEAKRVKKRLQVVSRPLPPQDDGRPHSFAGNLTAGILDPVLALLDPTKHWIKENGTWRSVKIRRWSAPQQTFKYANGNESHHRVENILRVVKMRSSPDPQVEPDLWTAYLNEEKNLELDGNRATVDRHDFITQLQGASLVFCDNAAPKPLQRLEDLIISVSGVRTNECMSN
jgi:hypothetical protein